MRYINIQDVLPKIPLKVIKALRKKHQKIVAGNDGVKTDAIDRGNATWVKVRSTLEKFSKRKCWYTESKNPGCVNDVDHYRPKGKKLDSHGHVDYWYWFLAFDPENYRLSCQFSNRPNDNPLLRDTGGKHQHFPLLDHQAHAIDKTGIATENPVLLDPCVKLDCDLLQFQPDGRPVVAQAFKDDPTVCLRVEKSNLILNLDYPTFNEDREALYNEIRKLIARGDRYGDGNPALEDVKDDLKNLMSEGAPYSRAAECYVRCFRDRGWVENILLNP